eukprot:tig00000734_g3762.t1
MTSAPPSLGRALQKATMPMGCYKIGTVTLDTTVSVNGNTYRRPRGCVSGRLRPRSLLLGGQQRELLAYPRDLAVAFFTSSRSSCSASCKMSAV